MRIASPSEKRHGKDSTTGVAPRILPLTSLRFFAALYVVLHHSLRNPFPSITDATIVGRLQRFGFSSVTFFFVLSGYILAMVYLRDGHRLDRRRFWMARIARIYPLYLATLLLDVPNLLLYRMDRYGLHAAVSKTAVTFFGNCLLLQEWFPRLHGLDFPNWSISVEAVFYLAFPWLGLWLWRMRMRYAVAVAVAWYLGEWLCSFAGRLNPFAHMGPLWAMYLFAGGIVLARVHLWIAADPARQRRLRQGAPMLAIVTAAIFVACALGSAHLPLIVFPNLLLLPIFAPLILAFAAGNHFIERVFSVKWLVVLGEASYGLYLLHVPVWTWMFARAHLPVTHETYLLFLLIAIGLSVVSYYLFEVPARRYLLRRLSASRRESEATAVLAQ